MKHREILLLYRIDTGSVGVYHIEAKLTGTAEDTKAAPTGMDADRLTLFKCPIVLSIYGHL